MLENEGLKIISELTDKNALVIDVRKGGLILGASHKEEGIALLSIFRINGYEVLLPFAVMEGGEYILNQISSKKYKETLSDMNNFFQPISHKQTNIKTDFEYTIYQINKGEALLVEEGQMIINKFATLKYLHQLELLNNLYSKNIKAAPSFRYRDMNEKIQRNTQKKEG